MIGDEHAIVAEVQSQLEVAELNLEWTRVYSHANGFVTNVQLREGDYLQHRHAGTHPASTATVGGSSPTTAKTASRTSARANASD